MNPYWAQLARRNWQVLLAVLLFAGFTLVHAAAFRPALERYRSATAQAFRLVMPLEAVAPDAVSVAGGKATNLATMGNVLGLRVPKGFVVTACALNRFLHESGLSAPIASILERIDVSDPAALEAASETIREMVRHAELPPSLSAALQ